MIINDIDWNYIFIYGGICTYMIGIFFLLFQNYYNDEPVITNKTNILKENAEYISNLLKTRAPLTIKDITDDLYILPPFIEKNTWLTLGDHLKQNEKLNKNQIDGSKWISLRLDGKGFSKQMRRMRAKNLFPFGYSTKFGLIMQHCCLKLMKEFNAKYSYTQSDEITIIIPPASIINGNQQPHLYNGRTEKICSLASSIVTAEFNMQMFKHALKKDVAIDFTFEFDCRTASYCSEIEALSLILWRAYDCSINGVSDAIYKSTLPNRKHVMRLSTDKKLIKLNENELLPLPIHQTHGSFYCRVKRLIKGYNPKINELQDSLRYQFAHVPGNILKLYSEGKLILKDDEKD